MPYNVARMARFGFPSVMGMSEELVSLIIHACGLSSRGKNKQEERRELLVVALLALFPGLPFRQLADACWRERLKQQELKGILEKLCRKKVVECRQPLYFLIKQPPVAAVALWLQDSYFAEFCRLSKEWAKQISSPFGRSPVGLMFGGFQGNRLQVMPPGAPDFLSAHFLCRILRLLGEHSAAYRILNDYAHRPELLDYRVSFARPMKHPELRRVFYALLENKYEPASSLPKGMQTEALRDNIPLECLVARKEDEFFTNPDEVLKLCKKSADAELLFAIIFHCLQKGEWVPIRTLAAQEDTPEDVKALAGKLCRWTDKQNWSSLRGIQRLVSALSTSVAMFAPLGALALCISKSSVKALCEDVFSSITVAFGRASFSLSDGMDILRTGRRSSENANLFVCPIGYYLLLLAVLLHPDTVEISPDEMAAAAAACAELHGNGLTLYSRYMAAILLSMGSFSAETQAKLEQMAESRPDLPPIPGLKVFAGEDALVLDKFLALVQECTAENKRAAGRMDWLLELDEDGSVSEIVPIFCTCNKKGKLSDGRRAALSALQDGKYDEVLTDQDRVVIASLRCVTTWSGDCYYLPPDAVSQLCGHPHLRVQWNNQLYRDVTLTLLPPRLNIRTRGDSCILSLPEQVCDEPVLEMTEEGKFGLRMPSSAENCFHQLINRLGKRGELRLPASGRQQVAEALTALSGQFRLTGDLSITHGNLPEVDSASRLVAQLSGRDGVFSGNLGIEAFDGLALLLPGRGEETQVVNRGEEKVLLHRNLKQEKDQLSSLLQACPTLQQYIASSTNWQTDDPETALDILSELQDYGSDKVELRWPEGQALSLFTLQSGSSFNLRVGEGADHWLKVGGDVQVAEHKVLKFTELLELVRQRSGNYIRLQEGQFLRLTRSITRQLETLGNLMPPPDKSGRVRKTLELSPAAVALLAGRREKEALPAALEKPVAQVQKQLAANGNSKLPAALKAELRDYQLTGYRWLMQMISSGIGACLADDMGLGKTVQILTTLLAKSGEGPSLVLAPASVCANWVREAGRFTPTLRVHQLRTTGRSELLEKLGERDVLVCSYGLLVSESDSLSQIAWNAVVLDEAQSIKNSRSQRAEQTRRLQAKYRIAATGTPLENNLLELWSLMEFLNPGFLGARSSFLSRFKDSPSRLRQLISPFVLRRLKGDVLDELPEKNEQILHVELSEQERALYEALRRQALQEMNAETERFRVLAHLTRLRRLCCHPLLGAPDCGLNSSAKLEALRELAAELRSGGHRALIFSQFTDVLEHVRALCEEEQFSYLYLDGSTPTAVRSRLVDEFQQGETDFFLISLKAGGVGLNLTAADYVILLDPWWNPATEDQASDRAHRIGQDKNVTVCRLVCADTIEQRVLELHARKRELVDSVLSDSAAAAETLSVEELLQLLK